MKRVRFEGLVHFAMEENVHDLSTDREQTDGICFFVCSHPKGTI